MRPPFGACRFVGPILVKTGVHPRLASRLFGVCRRDGYREYCGAFGLRRSALAEVRAKEIAAANTLAQTFIE
jgi:hypothetical protein